MKALNVFDVLENDIENEIKDYPFFYSLVSTSEYGQNSVAYGQSHFNLSAGSKVTKFLKMRKDSMFLFLYLKIQVAESSGSRNILGVNTLTPPINYLSANLKLGDVKVTIAASGGGAGKELTIRENIQATQGLQTGQGSFRRNFLFPPEGQIAITFVNEATATREISGYMSGRQIII